MYLPVIYIYIVVWVRVLRLGPPCPGASARAMGSGLHGLHGRLSDCAAPVQLHGRSNCVQPALLLVGGFRPVPPGLH